MALHDKSIRLLCAELVKLRLQLGTLALLLKRIDLVNLTNEYVAEYFVS